MQLHFSSWVIAPALFTFALAGCQSAQTTSASSASVSSSSRDVATGAVSESGNVAVMWIRGMACPQCSYNVDLQLKKVSGVERVKVDMSSGQVQAWLSPSNPPTREQLENAVKQATFTLVRLDMPGDAVQR